MTPENLTALLAERLLGWKALPNRFIKSGRTWIPRWRFNPLRNLGDAFLLLDRAGGTYTLTVDPSGVFTAEVRIGNGLGAATGEPKARTITLAIVHALGLEAIE